MLRWLELESGTRMAVSLLIAFTLHAAAVVGLGFSFERPAPPQRSLDVTLTQHASQQAPDKADFIAQANQLGSGTADEARRLSTPEPAPVASNKTARQAAQPSPSKIQVQHPPETLRAQQQEDTPDPAPVHKSGTQKQVTTQARNQHKAATRTEQKTTQARPAPSGNATSLLARSLEIASLQAQLDTQQEAYAKRPRVQRLTSVSAVSRDDAVYLDNWRRRIEEVGNMNYPEEAHRRQLYGQLRVLTVIRPDGSLKDVRILKSSGHRILDDAAVRIVQLAAPFQPFSVEMRKRTDLLEIIRTWKFEKKGLVY